MIERVVIDVDRARVVRLQMPPDPHRSSVCDDVECSGPFEDVEWSADGRQVAFLPTSRDHKEAHLRVADTDSGRVRQVLEEKVATYYESGNDAHNWRFLPASNEVIWFSERDNWGQLYLYDLQTGRLKNQITTGEGTSRSCSGWMRRTVSSTSAASARRRVAIRISFISIGSDSMGRT